MSEIQPQEEYPEIEYVVTVKKRSLVQRLGCFAVIVVWFMVMMIPFFFIVLAVNGEIRFGHSGDVPDKHEHPLLLISLVMEADYRGLSSTNSSVERPTYDDLCMETHVSYLLWEGEGEAATYCDCYTRDENDDWQFTETTTQNCE